MKATNYSKINNLLLVVSFNQPTDNPLDTQPIKIEARVEAITDEGAVRNVSKTLNVGAVRNVSKTLNVGAVQNTKLTNKEIYTKVKAFNAPLANLLKSAILEALNEDVSI